MKNRNLYTIFLYSFTCLLCALTLQNVSFLEFSTITIVSAQLEDGGGESDITEDESSSVPVRNSTSAEPSTPNPCSNPFTYKTLVDIPGFTEEDGLVTICPSSIGTFLQTIFNYIIGIAILLTVVMIIYGGVQYATVEAVTGKSQAKATIMGALQGLALALGSVLILTTINPDLVKFNLDIGRLNLRTATEGGTGSLVDLGSGTFVGTGVTGGGGASQNGRNFTRSSNGLIQPCPSALTTVQGRKICPEFYSLLKSAADRAGVTLVVGQTFGGRTPSKSRCHQITVTSISGSCSDIGVSPRTPENWTKLCKGLSETLGLYSNNETKVAGCVQYIGKDNTSARTTGPHLHVIYTGGSASTGGGSSSVSEGSVGPKRGAVLKGSFENPQPSPGIQAMIDKMKSENKRIGKIVVTGTGGSNATIAFYIQGYQTPAATIPNIKIGRNGLSPERCGVGTSCKDDEATPRGKYILGHPGERWNDPNRTPYLANGVTSMGLAVYNIIPQREIHLHGTRNDTQEVTKGCIRLSNDDIIVVGPYFMKGDTTIEIK